MNLGLADLLRARAIAAENGLPGPADRSVILVWLDGGPPQHETYDPKPQAPTEFRGPLKAMSTKVPGILVSELLPNHALLMDKMSIIRSMHHDNGARYAAAPLDVDRLSPIERSQSCPSIPLGGLYRCQLAGARKPEMPASVGLPQTHSVGLVPGYHGGAYLGSAYNPFVADGNPNSEKYRVPGLELPSGVDRKRMLGRRTLLASFDRARRDVDAIGSGDALDRFDQQAFKLVLGDAARQAFDIRKEDPRLRDRYGRNQWGQSALLARRLVEAGVRFVTLTFSGWDYHSSLERGMKSVLPRLDSAVGSLVADLDDRGLLDSTMVLVMGEFGPRAHE